MKHTLTFRYALHQFAYWAASAGIMSFATAFLLSKGFPASRVGLLMACASILSGITQPILASMADRAKTCILPKLTGTLTGISILAFALLLIDGLPAGIFAGLYLLGVWSFDAMIPLMNAFSVYYNERGVTINYGMGRAAGSLAYAISALGLGYVLELLGNDWMVRAILILLPVCGLLALTYPKLSEDAHHAPSRRTNADTDTCTVGQFFLRYRWYCVSLLGVLFLAMFHAMTENYLIAILGRLGGDSRHVGISLFVATVAEAIILVFFDRIRTVIPDNRLLKLAALSFLLKSVLFLAAPNLSFIYAAQLLQTTSYGFLSPTQVYYANAKVAIADMVKGQAFITASYTLGCALGNLCGGVLMEHFGVVAILLAGIAMAAAGTVIFFLTLHRKDAWLRETA